jgi:hypothetical protein
VAEILGILLLAVTLGGDVAIATAREDEQFAMWVDDHQNGEPANDESFKQALHDAAATRRHMVEVYWRNLPREC